MKNVKLITVIRGTLFKTIKDKLTTKININCHLFTNNKHSPEMLNYKIPTQKKSHRTHHNHFSLIRLPAIDKKTSESNKKSL